jgi:ABC-type uncharacterized transport system involved in gliding motility auxiliary subunit
MKTSKFNSTIGLIALFGILIFGNIVTNRQSLKLDITQEGLYTLSEGSVNIVGKLDAPMDIKMFFSQSLENVPPLLKTYQQRVRAMLVELQSTSEHINLEFVDPEPDSDEELLAQRYGITGQPLSAAGSFYFGMVFSNYSGQETIAYLDFNKEDTLEYDIVRRIYLLSMTGKPKVGVLSSLEVLGTPAPPPQFGMPQQAPSQNPAWLFTQELQQSYELVKIDPAGDSLEKDLDLLLVIHAKNLNQNMQYAIDQFVMSGKRALFFVDSFMMRDQQQQNRFQPPTSDHSFDQLFSKWGVDYQSNKVVVDPIYAYVQRGAGSSTKVPVVLTLGPASMSDDVSTRKLNNIMMLYTGALKKKEGVENVEFKPLISSSKEASTEDKQKLLYTRPEQLLADLKGGTPQHMAGLYSGKFRSAFDKAPEGVEGEHLSEVAESNHIVIVADVDMLEDQYWARSMNLFPGQNMVQAINQNTVLLNNLVEKLTGNNDLISLRSRSRFLRPFDKVLVLEENARKAYQEREQALQEQLQKVEAEINQLIQKADPGQRVIVSDDVQNQIKSFQDKKAKVAKELRDVRKNLRSSIDELGTFLQAINILLMPLLIALFGLIVIISKSRRTAV